MCELMKLREKKKMLPVITASLKFWETYSWDIGKLACYISLLWQDVSRNPGQCGLVAKWSPPSLLVLHEQHCQIIHVSEKIAAVMLNARSVPVLLGYHIYIEMYLEHRNYDYFSFFLNPEITFRIHRLFRNIRILKRVICMKLMDDTD